MTVPRLIVTNWFMKKLKKKPGKGLMTTISFSLQRAHSARYGNCPCD